MNFDEFLQQAARLEDLVWRKYRRPPARRAVEERMGELGLRGYDAYLDQLRRDPAELAGVADLMHITVTRFFRDGECWRVLGDEILPALLEEKGDRSALRAWSAGCCGGEEPYSLAMLWLDRTVRGPGAGTIEIVASDIDEASLQRARQGCYDKGSLREVPGKFIERFFTREGRRYCVLPPVTSLVRLERRNIMIDPLPADIDLILCRYLVFTYYSGARVRAAAERLWETLRPGGVLMIGKKEELAGEALDFFAPVPGRHSFYRRRG